MEVLNDLVKKTENSIQIDEIKCTQCGMCIKLCDSQIIGVDSNGFPKLTNPSNCKSCGHCVAACNNNAITHSAFSLENISQNEFRTKNINKQEFGSNFFGFICSKHSCRHFQDKKIEKETISLILKAGAQAPTAKNRQWRYFLVIQNKEIIRKIELDLLKEMQKKQKFLKLANSKFSKKIISDPLTIDFLQHLYNDNEHNLKEFRENPDYSPIFHNAPCLIMNYAWKDSGVTGDPFAQDHCTIAQTYIMLQAESLGLGSCIIGYASTATEIIEKYIDIPKNHKIYGVFCLGYPKFEYPQIIKRNLPEVLWN